MKSAILLVFMLIIAPYMANAQVSNSEVIENYTIPKGNVAIDAGSIVDIDSVADVDNVTGAGNTTDIENVTCIGNVTVVDNVTGIGNTTGIGNVTVVDNVTGRGNDTTKMYKLPAKFQILEVVFVILMIAAIIYMLKRK